MYIENYDFKEWMQKLFDKLDELCKDVRALHTADKVLPEDDNLLDNQDLCLLFKVSIKTLQRYRAIGVLPYFLPLVEKCITVLRMYGHSLRNGSMLLRCASSRKKHCVKKRRSEIDKPEWWVSTAPAFCFLWFP